ncbi:MAG TPA: hypothetical protein VFZ59_19495 [Verrucomicrobiae bacterium]|nr:hypothetical protein [Verrucomicrobiae bacterium]
MAKRTKSRTKQRAQQLRRAYELMRARFGHQRWWPGETPFEVCVGAILTQNTSWTNVERAIANLKSAGVLDARKMFALPETKLAQLIRPAGYFNVKARRLRSFLHALVEEYDGELHRLFAGETTAVRNRLLDINGIGPETADCLLLYAGGHHSFVVDAYTKRIFSRHGWCSDDADYDSLKHLCESALSGRDAFQPRPKLLTGKMEMATRWNASLPGSGGQCSNNSANSLPDPEHLLSRPATTISSIQNGGEGRGEDVLRGSRVQDGNPNPANFSSTQLDYWQDYHAQLVMVGKHHCRKREPRCQDCPLHPLMPSSK